MFIVTIPDTYPKARNWLDNLQAETTDEYKSLFSSVVSSWW